jgi:translation initiation factor 2A
MWNPSGTAAVVFTTTTVDTTGSSYYGSTGLHLISDADCCSIPLPKEGMVLDVQWCPDPTVSQFIVISGRMPAAACLYNAKCDQLFLFGEAHRNTISWAPHGRFVCLGGFGNLAGEMDFWDRNKKKKMGSATAACAVTHGWSPDSRLFMCATTRPRMNVDNGVEIFRYNGSAGKPIANLELNTLYSASWLPAKADVYPNRAASPLRKNEKEAIAAAVEPVKMFGRYRPPSAGGGMSLSDRMRSEREGSSSAKSKVISKTASFAMKRGGGASAAHVPLGGAVAVEEGGMSKSALKREKMKKKKDEEDKIEKIKADLASSAAAEAAAAAADDPVKQAKKINKALKAIADLKAKKASGVEMNEDQKGKIEKEGELLKQLKDLKF